MTADDDWGHVTSGQDSVKSPHTILKAREVAVHQALLSLHRGGACAETAGEGRQEDSAFLKVMTCTCGDGHTGPQELLFWQFLKRESVSRG